MAALALDREFTLHAHTATLGIPAVDDVSDEQLQWSEDAVIEVGLSLDPSSETILEVVKKAAKRLEEEYGVRVSIIPRLEYWGYSAFSTGFGEYPRIRVNGHLIATGDDVSEDMIIDAVLALLGMELENDAGPDVAIPRFRPYMGLAEAGAVA